MRIFVWLFLLIICLTKPLMAAPAVVVSIAPIHSLVSMLTLGVENPQLLLPPGSSPHHANLKPSQAKAMANADLFIWVGPELESFLLSPVARLVKPGHEIRILELKGLKLLPQRKGGNWDDQEGHKDLHNNENQRFNPHVWLSPSNAIKISFVIKQQLVLIDPANRDTYELNYRHLKLRIDRLDHELSNRLKRLEDHPYLVFHDAYPYFEFAFGLKAVGSIKVSAERAPSAKRLSQIINMVSESSAICLFSEPQFSPALAQRLTAEPNLKLGILDPQGIDIPTGPNSWFELMRNLAKNLEDCLADTAK